MQTNTDTPDDFKWLDEVLENLIIHTANEYGGFEGFDEEGARDGFNQAKSAIIARFQAQLTALKGEQS
jgi:hypothetical protein